MATTTSTISTVRCKGKWDGGVRTELKIRGFEPFLMDEPKPLGGTDLGPNPMEYVMAALNGCVSVMINLIATEMDFKYEAVEFVAEGDIDIRGLMGTPGVNPHFAEVRQRVRIKTDESPERVEELKEKAESRCPAVNLFRDAKVKVVADWEII